MKDFHASDGDILAQWVMIKPQGKICTDHKIIAFYRKIEAERDWWKKKHREDNQSLALQLKRSDINLLLFKARLKAEILEVADVLSPEKICDLLTLINAVVEEAKDLRS